ncbi:MAG: hypothetical protein AB7O88_03755 [Reyranellaceae bacterium]
MSYITDRLDLGEDTVRRRIAFLESYGIHQLEQASIERAPREHWISQIPTAAAATAFLEALELQLLLDPAALRVQELAKRAIENYERLGMGIAALLRGIFEPYSPVDNEVSRFADSAERSLDGKFEGERSESESVNRDAALHSRSQQMMVWLGALSTRQSSRNATQRAMQHVRLLHETAFAIPYGTIGQPMGLYCETAMAAVEQARGDHQADFGSPYVRKRAELVTEQSAVVETARRDHHAWNNLLAHIPFVDFSTLAVTLIGVRHSGMPPDLLLQSTSTPTQRVDVTAEIALRLKAG